MILEHLDLSQPTLASPVQLSLLIARTTGEKIQLLPSRSHDDQAKFLVSRFLEQLCVLLFAFPALQQRLSTHTLARELADL